MMTGRSTSCRKLDETQAMMTVKLWLVIADGRLIRAMIANTYPQIMVPTKVVMSRPMRPFSPTRPSLTLTGFGARPVRCSVVQGCWMYS
jgi:hypothetical protein